MSNITYRIAIDRAMTFRRPAHEFVTIANAFEHEARGVSVYIDGIRAHDFELAAGESLADFVEAQLQDLATESTIENEDTVRAVLADLNDDLRCRLR